ncbi:MAG TPA: PAC2 family protein [Acidimicrobiales bacterium]|jgi:predicted ATP-grasp superfamily ATP-dependent carboligase|nr:PAC2 family protein [Acidimicrobiales bacterium]
MALYEKLHERTLDQPVLVIGLDGWIDAGAGAAAAVAHLASGRMLDVLGQFDGDALIDHRSRRPVAHIVDGVNRGLTWPRLDLRAGTDDAGHDLLLLSGPEPDLRWHEFTDAVVALASELGVRLAVGLGAFPAPVPHTHPVRLATTSPVSELAHQVGYVRGTLDVPAGVEAALEIAFETAGIPAIGLWARVPHYVAAMAYPAASAALIDGLTEVASLQLDSRELHEAAARARLQIDALVANSDEHRRLVTQLEAQAEAELQGEDGGLAGESLPSGDELAAELERFLRGEPGA